MKSQVVVAGRSSILIITIFQSREFRLVVVIFDINCRCILGGRE